MNKLTIQELPHVNPDRIGHAYALRDHRNICVAVVGEVDAATDDGTAERYARLFAAAPDLLEACRMAMEVLAAWDRSDAAGKAHDAVSAAIAKAA